MKTRSTVDGKSLGDAYFNRITLSSGETAHLVKRNGTYEGVTWGEIHGKVLSISKFYKTHHIQPGDKVAILSNSRSEWNTVDLANLCQGIITIPIYQSNTAEDVAYLLEHSEAKLIFAEDSSQVEKLATTFSLLKRKIPVVTFEPFAGSKGEMDLFPFSEVSGLTPDKDTEESLRKAALAITSDKPATIVYTSGTTGQPKGVVLTHGCFLSELRTIISGFDLSHDDTALSFLPTAHILGRVESLIPLLSGIKLAFAENINSVSQNIQEVKPTLLVSVPRIYEKIFTKIQSEIATQPAFTQKIFQWAVTTGSKAVRLRSDRKPVPVTLGLKYAIADQLVFSKVRARMGGKLRFTVSGGAPLSPDLCAFFHACGIKIMEGYGLTETTAAVCVNFPEDYSFGTVGKPLGDAEFRIATDGEILVKGPMVFKEYYKNPTATAEVFTEDGWFRTGDIGEITERGFLKITDRKKELIVTSAGKNIAPQKLENILKGNRFVSQAMVYGDKQKYLSALITLNEPEIKKWAEQHQVTFGSYPDLVKTDPVVGLIGEAIKEMNAHLASFETIKKFRILPSDFTIETGELTPSLKVKRKVVVQKYQNYLDEMYGA